MYSVIYTNKFKKQIKQCNKRGLDISLIERAIQILSEKGELPIQYKPHKLIGKYSGMWECHIKPDWLMVWTQNDNELILMLVATGSHSDLF